MFHLPPPPAHLLLEESREEREGKKPYVFKLVVHKSTKTFLPKLTFAKEILTLPVKPLQVQESTTACQNKKKKNKASLLTFLPKAIARWQ